MLDLRNTLKTHGNPNVIKEIGAQSRSQYPRGGFQLPVIRRSHTALSWIVFTPNHYSCHNVWTYACYAIPAYVCENEFQAACITFYIKKFRSSTRHDAHALSRRLIFDALCIAFSLRVLKVSLCSTINCCDNLRLS